MKNILLVLTVFAVTVFGGEYEYGTILYENKDFSGAMELFLIASKKNVIEAQYLIGFMFSNGLGVEKDDNKAQEFYKKSADQGDSQSQCNLGVIIRRLGGEENLNKAWNLFQKASFQGDYLAKYNIATMFFSGESVVQNYIEAFDLFLQVSGHGDLYAQYNVGMMLFCGYGVKEDHPRAARFFQLSSDQGFHLAQYNLAFMYIDGDGVDQDICKGEKLLRMAANQEDKHAIDSLEELHAKFPELFDNNT